MKRSVVSRFTARMDALLALRAARGPYRFLVAKWDGITDVDLAAGVLGTEFFRRDLRPLPLPVETVPSLLAIAPHQDDETIGAGGTMLLASRGGAKLDVLFVTDGAQPNFPQGADASVEVRDAEAKEVCAELGAAMHTLGISNVDPAPTAGDLERLAGLLAELRPAVVAMPWLLDWPPKHRLATHLLYLAHRKFGLPPFEVWGYQVHNTLYPNGYVDVTEVAERKLDLLRRYRSQVENYRRYDHMAMGMGAWNARFLPEEIGDRTERYVEVFFTLPRDELFALVERFYLRDLAVTYRGDRRVLDGVRDLHRAVVGAGR